MQCLNWIWIFFIHILHRCRPTHTRVPPPTNLTLQCRNLTNILHWEYSEPSLKPRFTINITAISSKVVVPADCVDTANYHCDLSSLKLKEEYCVFVTAAVGQDTSESENLEFSYLTTSLTDHTCYFDLPSISVTNQSDDVIHFKFLHPGEVYKLRSVEAEESRTRDTEAKELGDFKYTVQMQNKKLIFTCMEHQCAQEISVKGMKDDHCVSIEGEWNEFSVRGVRKYCPTSQTAQTDLTALYAVCGIILCGGAVLFAGMLLYKRTSANSTRIPKILRQLILHTSQGDTEVLRGDEYSTVQHSPEAEEPRVQNQLGTSLEPDVQRPPSDAGSGSVSSLSERQGDGYNLGRDLDGDVEESEDCEENQSASTYMHRERLAEDV